MEGVIGEGYSTEGDRGRHRKKGVARDLASRRSWCTPKVERHGKVQVESASNLSVT